MTSADRNRSLEDLEGDAWGEPPPDATYLVSTVHDLRRKPLRDLTTEDLRLLLGQGIGPAVLVPLALGILRQNPMAEGDMYPGDLLRAVLRLQTSFWHGHPALASTLREIVASVRKPPSELQHAITEFALTYDSNGPLAGR